VIAELARDPGTPYAAQQVVVIYRPGAATPQATLAKLGVDRTRRAFADAAHLGSMRASAEQAVGQPLLGFENAYVLHLTRSSVAAAVATLRANPDVAYAAPNWTVTTVHPPGQAAPAATAAAATATATAAPGVPSNYTLTSSAQALLNRPGVDAVPAYPALAARGQLPGQGEIITNLSLGTLTDASAAADTSDPCNFYASVYGPTTIVRNGQRYLDWPSMPLIPTYTADSNGVVDPTGETCGDDPTLTEVGLDFSMMAPLPHDRQRPEALGTGLTDLLGIAPGASYRLVLPKAAGGASTDVDAALLGAANQTPQPSVITASLEFGYDQFGFSGRYFEDDPLTHSIVTTIVHAYHIVMCVSSGDGLRTFTNAPVSPSGGSVATEVGKPATDLNDVGFSDAPSRDEDSGAIDVGGSTLDDIFAAPPGNPQNAALRAQHAFPATRYTGARNYSSGFGSRVNVSAPGDNVLSFAHPMGGGPQAVQVLDEGGTSASAPETAAAAAVVLQVARLTGNHKLQDPLAVRQFLADTGTPLPDPEQADQHLNVGPQIDIGRAVSTLLGTPRPRVVRVAVEQRQQASALGGTISTVTDPPNIPLTGRLADAWITIAPDWLGLPGGATFELSGPRGVLATTPWARLQPADILGQPIASSTSRTVALHYTASVGGRVIASTDIPLTFGPTDGTVQSVTAPLVPPVVRGGTIPVHYDISRLTGATDPILVVSQPGRIESATGLFFRPAFTAPLTVPTGTVDVPVSALPGAGIYGIGIQDAPGGWFSANRSTFAFTRVAPPSDAQPAPPALGDGTHYLEVPYHGSFQLSYDVRDVPRATDAVAEFSAPGPTTQNNYKPFNYPNGSVRDANGHDTGSVAFVPLSGTHGTVTLNGGTLGLDPTMNHVVRILPTRGGVAAGEASGVSTISMDGVLAADGGFANNGFGVDEHGGAGMLTSDQALAGGGTLASVERFDQSSIRPTSTVVSSTTHLYETIDGCAGLFHDGVGLYGDFDPATGSEAFRTLAGGAWTPPDSLGNVFCAAHNQDTDDTAILSSAGHLQVSTPDIAANTFSQPVDLSPALSGLAAPALNGFAQDTATNQALVSVSDGADTSKPAPLVTADLPSGAVRAIPGVTTGFSSGVAADSVTHRAVVGSFEGFGVYDLAAGSGTLVQPGGSTYEQPAADSTRGLFLVREVAPPDFFGGTPNNNAMSAVIVTDEHGTVLRRIEEFNFFRVFLFNMGDYLQLDTSRGTAFTFGPGAQQLFPFSYQR
jgi:hypothetical protein